MANNVHRYAPPEPSSYGEMPLTEGQIHESAAEVVDSPLLILRIAQSRAESSRLVDWLRGAGLGSEGQISQNLLRRALAAIGVHSPQLLEQIAECFEVLDPEATGTVSFSELHGELRRVKKLLTPHSYAQAGGGGGGRRSGSAGPTRGGSAPLQRAPQGFRHEDGSPFSAVELEAAAASFRRQGELGQALRALEAALAIHCRVHGERSELATECSRQVADVCNSLGMQMLQRDDFVGCHALLRRAQARGQGDRAMFAITLNNLACYHRRRGHLKVALAHLSKAVDIESHCDGAHKPADTHLNMCAVQSELGCHHEAMHHAKVALRLLREELGLPPPTPHASGGLGRVFGGSAAGLLTGDAGVPQPSAERMAVLAIAHHNLAVEQEALRLPDEATRSFGEAAAISSQQLGEEHPVATALRATYEANLQQRERAMAAERHAALAARKTSKYSGEERRTAELRKQASVQRHIETVRLMRRDGSARAIRVKPHERRNPDGIPKILQDVGEEGDVAGALREWLAKNAGRVMGMFRSFDYDGSGTIDRSEFRRAMRAMGLQAPTASIDAIFNEFDADKGGEIDFRELNRILRQGSNVAVKKVAHASMAISGMQQEVALTKADPDRIKPLKQGRPGSASATLPSGMQQRAAEYAAPSPTRRVDPVSDAPPAPTGGAPRDMVEPDDVANAEEEEAFDAGMRQNAMEFDAADVNHDTKLDFAEFSAMVRGREHGNHTEAELRARFNAIDENNNNRIDLDEFIRFSLRDALSRSAARVIDLFREWDDDDSGSIDLKEFRKAIGALGFDAPKEEIDAVFKQLDADGSGSIEYKELNKKLRQGAGSSLDPSLQPGAMGDIKGKSENKHKLRRGQMSGKVGSVLSSSVQLVPEEGKSVIEQLREILNQNAVRVIDLFRSWDDDGNGKVDAKEFRKAVAALGYKAPKKDVDEVFGAFDVDKSGEIDYHELNRALRRGGESKLDPSLQPGTAGEIQLKASNKSPKRRSESHGKGKTGFTTSLANNLNAGKSGETPA